MNHLYRLNDEELGLLQRASEAATSLAKHAPTVDRDGVFPEESLSALRAGGLFGLTVAKDAGGLGAGPRVFAAVVEELAGSCASTAMIYVMHVTATQAIAASSTLSAKASTLREIAAGKHLTTLAFSEKGSRSHFWAPVSKLAPHKDGGFRVSAFKSWVTAANHADSYVSSALAPSASTPLESVVYLADRKANGIRPLSAFDGMGLRGNDSAPVQYEDLAVSKDHFISQLGEGSKTMLEVVLPWFSVGTSAMALGLCRAATDATAAHMSGAKLEHLGTSLRDIQVLRARLADMATRTDAARCLLSHMTQVLENPGPDAPLWVLKTRLSALQTALHVSDLAMKACGGAAYSRHMPVERIFRDARAGWVMAPTADHLEDFIGKALTGLPLF